MQAQERGKPEFKYGYVMIDKSRQEMAAVHQLVVTLDSKGYLLCYFHFLQEWERFLRSKESGVAGVCSTAGWWSWRAWSTCGTRGCLRRRWAGILAAVPRRQWRCVARYTASLYCGLMQPDRSLMLVFC